MTDAQADRANCVGARSRSGSGSRRSSRSAPSSSSRAAGGKGTIQSDSEIVPRIQARWPRISGASTTVSSGRLGAIRRSPRERLGGRDYIALERQEGRGDHGALAEARRESVDHPREPLAAHGVGIEEPELAHSRGSETPGRDADEAHRARHALALQASARPAVGLDRSGVTTEGQVVQVLAVLPEASGQHGARDTLEPADRGEAELSEGLRRHTPDTPDQLDRERGEKAGLPARRDRDEAVRLLEL